MSERHNDLVRALVTSISDGVQRYTTSASFKTQIDFLARILPPCVAGLAIAAEESDEAIRAHIEAIRTMPPMTFPDIRGIK